MPGLGIHLGSRGSGVALLRTVPVSANEAFLVAPHPTLGAIAVHLLKGNGADMSTPSASVGGSFGAWRIQGLRVVADIADDPLTEYSEILYQGIGAQQIAINVSNIWAGHYHGFGATAAYSQTAPDMTRDAMIASATVVSGGQMLWSGATADWTDNITLNNDGSISTQATAILAADALTAYLDMTIMGTGFTRASLDNGASWHNLELLAINTSLSANIDTIIMRNPVTGTTATVTDDARAAAGFATKEIMRRSTDYKIYPNINPQPAGTALGNVTVNRTVTLDKTVPDPTISLSASISQSEGNSGTTNFTYTVTRSTAIGPVTVAWRFSGGTTSASDFAGGVYPSGGNVTLVNGQASDSFVIPVQGDTVLEPDENFTVSIVAPLGYAPGAATSATGTILNDDGASTYLWRGSVEGVDVGYSRPFAPNDNVTFASSKLVLTRGANASFNSRVVFGPISPPVNGVAYTISAVLEVIGGSPSAGTTVGYSVNSNGSSAVALPNAANGTQNYAIPAGSATGPIYLCFQQAGAAGSDNILRIASVGPAT